MESTGKPRGPSRRWRIACGIGVVAFAATVAACSSNGSTSNGTTSGAADAGSSSGTSATAPAGSGAPIKIMIAGTQNSPDVAYPGAYNAAVAAADAVNAAGGVSGHMIQIIDCNDNFNPSDAVACARQAVSEHVTALVGGVETFATQMYPILTAAKIPWVSGIVLEPIQMTSSLSFPFDSIAKIIDAGRLAVQEGGKKVVLAYHNDSPTSVILEKYAAYGVTEAGGTVVKAVSFPLTTTDFSPVAAQVVNAHADAIECTCNAQDSYGFAQALRQSGFNGPYVSSLDTFALSDLQKLGALAKNVYLTSTFLDPGISSPGVAQFNKEMASQPSSIPLDDVAEASWVGVHVIADVLKGQSDVSASTLISQLDKSTGLNGFGVLPNGISWDKPGPYPGLPRLTNFEVVAYTWNGSELVQVGSGFTNALTGSG
jgi:ABC-type branched-subunit amino acid transport system substrate-binding protein